MFSKIITIFLLLYVIYAVEELCHSDIGCFTKDGPMKHTGRLPQSRQQIGTKFYAYTTDSVENPIEVNPKDNNSLSIVVKGKPIAILIHGFSNNAKNKLLLSVKDSLIKFANISTVILVDWSNGAKSPYYEEAATNTQLVGREVALLTDTFRQTRDIDPKDVHLIGYSLGAHVSGFAGKFSQSKYNWSFGRITALDAAAPLFEKHPGSFVLKGDALFVDAIHSSAGHMRLIGEVGFVEPIGDVDFYPNNGVRQPRCRLTFQIGCSHKSSIVYFEASLSATQCQFTAYQCPNWTDFSAKKCSKNGDSRLGYYSYITPGRGVYYLSVTKTYPYC